MRFLAASFLAVLLASPALALDIDEAAIYHDIYAPYDGSGDPILFDGNPTFYRLAGQSAFIQTRTASSTSGGQLDGAEGSGSIPFTEIFPPPLASDYLTYSYLGVVDLNGTDTNGDPVVIDRSLVIAFQPGVAEGLRIDDLFSGYTESVLVNAFTTSFDSPEFLDMAFNLVGGQPSTSGAIAVATTDCYFTFVCDPPTQIQSSQVLDLIAFVGGVDGDEGVVVGTLEFGVTRMFNVVPEPGTAVLMGAGLGLLSIGRRRAA